MTALVTAALAITWALPVTAPASVVSGMNEAAWELALSGEQQLGAMQAHGVQFVRTDASWGGGQPSAPSASGPGYQFASFDALVTQLAAHQMSWLPIIDYSTPWAESVSGDPFSPPADDSRFAAYAEAIAARYGAHGSFWTENPQLPYEPVKIFEVWNEENTTMFWSAPSSPARYAGLYMQTRASILAVDPGAQVIVGGLLDTQPGAASEYVRAMFRAEPSLRGNVDGFGLHPYALNAAGVLASVCSLRMTLDSLGGASAPIDVTEFGWPTASGEAWRAAQMRSVGMSLANSGCGIGVVAPYVWYESDAKAGDYSLSSPSGLLPSGTAWFAGLSLSRTERKTDPRARCAARGHFLPTAELRGRRQFQRARRCRPGTAVAG